MPCTSGSRAADTRLVNAMSVDVEDYYQVSAFAGTVDRSKWDSFPSRVEDSTKRTLDLFAEAHHYVKRPPTLKLRQASLSAGKSARSKGEGSL